MMRTRKRATTTDPREPDPDRSPAPRSGRASKGQQTFALGLGANLPRGGQSAANTLLQAIGALTRHLGPLETASLYRSAPMSRQPAASPQEIDRQPNYYNTAVTGITDLSPDALLALAKAFELAAGREGDPYRQDAPRTLDIDLLLYGRREHPCGDRPELTLPHPRLRQRRFVLEPLAELLPDWPLPPDGRTVRDVLPEVLSQRVERRPWPPTAGNDCAPP
ncbi:MAG: 2-amino-4-hydroxy-6-hydroxymethyldihydropteridine diphosphokinase [Acidobacteriota bacterium]